jgi:hypothetical protein
MVTNVLVDPVGIMMFIGEKYNELADPNIGTANLQNEQFNHDICTTLSLYFFTPPSIMTSKYCIPYSELCSFDVR